MGLRQFPDLFEAKVLLHSASYTQVPWLNSATGFALHFCLLFAQLKCGCAVQLSGNFANLSDQLESEDTIHSG